MSLYLEISACNHMVFATNSRESTFAKTQRRCKLEIRERQAQHVNNQASNMNSKVA
jgi:hypothetical protein